MTNLEVQANEQPGFEHPPVELLRVTRDPRRLEAWSLVLASKGLVPLRRLGEDALELYVAAHEGPLARAELDAADAEELQRQRAEQADAALKEQPASRHAGAGALLVSLALLVFFSITGPRAGGSAWFAAGASDAERVLHGEWWRTITALSLHADAGHVLSNVGIGTLFVGAVMRSEGVGYGAALILASGTVGNVINAWAHQSLHSSVGFSTAVFGAIGLLGGLTFAHGQRRLTRLRPAWTALGGGLALLALLGSSERSDLFAHLFGALAGAGLGALTGHFGVRPKGQLGQWLAGAATLGVMVGAWWRAFS